MSIDVKIADEAWREITSALRRDDEGAARALVEGHIRSTVVAELRAQARWMRERASGLEVGNGFAPGIYAAARSLADDADTLEGQG